MRKWVVRYRILDHFFTEQNEDGTWSTPENMGAPVNTVDDDVFFVTTADGRRGYFSSDKLSGYGEKDIYYVDLPAEMETEGLTVLKGFIIPPPGQELPASTILYVTDKSTGETKASSPASATGCCVVSCPAQDLQPGPHGTTRPSTPRTFSWSASRPTRRSTRRSPEPGKLEQPSQHRRPAQRRACLRAKETGEPVNRRNRSATRSWSRKARRTWRPMPAT
jgi:hypothetical protein